jgi:hypothetical protein
LVFLWVIFALLEPDPLTWLNPDSNRIRFQNTAIKFRKWGGLDDLEKCPPYRRRKAFIYLDPDALLKKELHLAGVVLLGVVWIYVHSCSTLYPL